MDLIIFDGDLVRLCLSIGCFNDNDVDLSEVDGVEMCLISPLSICRIFDRGPMLVGRNN